jgi:hypothetical protein
MFMSCTDFSEKIGLLPAHTTISRKTTGHYRRMRRFPGRNQPITGSWADSVAKNQLMSWSCGDVSGKIGSSAANAPMAGEKSVH